MLPLLSEPQCRSSTFFIVVVVVVFSDASMQSYLQRHVPCSCPLPLAIFGKSTSARRQAATRRKRRSSIQDFPATAGSRLQGGMAGMRMFGLEKVIEGN